MFPLIQSWMNRYLINKITNLGTRLFGSGSESNLDETVPFSLIIDYPNFEGEYFAHYTIEAIKQEDPMSYYRDCSSLGIVLESVATNSKIEEMDSKLRDVLKEIYKEKKLKDKLIYKNPFNFEHIAKIGNFHIEMLKNKLNKHITREETVLSKLLSTITNISIDNSKSSSTNISIDNSKSNSSKSSSSNSCNINISSSNDPNTDDNKDSLFDIKDLSFELLNSLIFIEKNFHIVLSDCIKDYLKILLSLYWIPKSDITAALSKRSLEYKEEDTRVFSILMDASLKLQENFESFFHRINNIENELAVSYAINRYNGLIYILKAMGRLPNKISPDERLNISKNFLPEITTAFIHSFLSKTDLSKSFSKSINIGKNLSKKLENMFFFGLASLSIPKMTNSKQFDQSKIQCEYETLKYAFDYVIEIYSYSFIDKELQRILKYSEEIEDASKKLIKLETLLLILNGSSIEMRRRTVESFCLDVSRFLIDSIKEGMRIEMTGGISKIFEKYFEELKDTFEKSRDGQLLRVSHIDLRRLNSNSQSTGKYKTVMDYLKYTGILLILLNTCILLIKIRK